MRSVSRRAVVIGRAGLVMLASLPSVASPQTVPRAPVEVGRIASDETSAASALSRIGSVAVAPNGMVFATQSADGAIKVFDSAGKFVRSIGRRGEGPGEFGSVVGDIGFAGDSLWARDVTGRRINFFSLRDGTSTGVLRLPQARAGRCTGFAALLRSKVFVLNCSYVRPTATDSVVTVLVDSSGAELRTLFKVAGAPNSSLPVSTGTVTVTMLQPFAPVGRLEFAPNSSRIVLAAPAPFWNGRAGQVRLVIVNAAGAVRTVDISYPPRAFNDYDADTLIANRSQALAASGAARGYQHAVILRSMRTGLYKPEHVSEVGELKVGDDGSIWISAPYDPALWRVHDESGRLQYSVRVEKGLRVMQVSRDGFWAVRLDANDLPTILRFAVPAARRQ